MSTDIWIFIIHIFFLLETFSLELVIMLGEKLRHLTYMYIDRCTYTHYDSHGIIVYTVHIAALFMKTIVLVITISVAK